MENPAPSFSKPWKILLLIAEPGTPEWWLARHGWTNNFNYWETNGSSRFQVSGFKFQGTNTVVTWDAVTGRLYSIEANTNSLVTSHWSLVTSGLPATGVWTDTTHGADRMINYRLGVQRAP